MSPARNLPDGDRHYHACAVGSFEFHPEQDRLVWSDEVFRIHGFQPGEVVPTLGVLQAHKHPEDRASSSDAIRAARGSTEPFSFFHRMVDAEGSVRYVLTVGRAAPGEAGPRVEGYVVELTPSVRAQATEVAQEAVARSAARRAVIEQAKGVLMGRHGISADEAFDLLSRMSQTSNTKLNECAAAVVDGASRPGDNAAITQQ